MIDYVLSVDYLTIRLFVSANSYKIVEYQFSDKECNDMFGGPIAYACPGFENICGTDPPPRTTTNRKSDVDSSEKFHGNSLCLFLMIWVNWIIIN